MIPDDFLQAIRAAPDDDGPRLVYADWLDEHGDPARAEFIRVQCEVARAKPGRPRGALRKRQEELLAEHDFRWLELELAEQMERHADFPPEVDLLRQEGMLITPRPRFAAAMRGWDRLRNTAPTDRRKYDRKRRLHLLHAQIFDGRLPEPDGRFYRDFLFNSVEFQRGVLSGITMDLPTFIQHGEPVARLGVLRQLLVWWEDNSGETLTNGLGDAGIRVLSQVLPFTRLKQLQLDTLVIRELDSFRDFVNQPALHGLESLSLECCELQDEFVEELARSPYLEHLRRLDLSDNPLGDAASDAVLASPHLRWLSEFRINYDGGGVDEEGGLSEAGRERLEERFPPGGSED
jgi:uncharacterized protein (TIGR02996 family)